VTNTNNTMCYRH